MLARTYSGPAPCLPLPEEKIPEGLDWNAWLSQAAYRPFNQAWMGWEHWYDFCGGWMTNWGAHGIDMIQWAMGADESGPVETRPLTPGASGQCEMRYANGVPVRFVLGPDSDPHCGPHGGGVFVGQKGKLEINRNKVSSNPSEIADEIYRQVNRAEEEQKWGINGSCQAAGHIQNWFDCMRTRQKPNADVEIGHRTITAAHVMNITRRLGRALKWDPAKEQFTGDDEANRLTERPRRAGYELPRI